MVDYIVFGMTTNTKGRTDFGSFDNESMAGYYLSNFDLGVSAAIKPRLHYKFAKSTDCLRFEFAECLFEKNMITVICTRECSTKARNEVDLDIFKNEICSMVNETLNEIKIDFPLSKVRFPGFPPRVLTDRFWIPVEKNESEHRVYWYRVQVADPVIQNIRYSIEYPVPWIAEVTKRINEQT